VQPEMVAYRTHHEITCLRVIDKRGEEELLFLVKVPDGAPEIEVDEIVRDVAALRHILQFRDVEKAPSLRQRVMMIVCQRYQ
jgi:hypothetical protein